MSDFDKEAEREKLREKYDDEEEKRAATEQMSELLLKGATMTNAHCTDCGDPIFRYDGQEFCPTCQKPVARDQAEDGEQGDHIEVADPSNDATVQFGDGADTEAENGADDSTATEAADPASHPPAADQRGGNSPEESAGRSPAEEQPAGESRQKVPSADPGRTPGSADGRSSADGSDIDTRSAPATEPQAPAAGNEGTPRGGQTDQSVTTELSAAESLLAETVHRFAQRAADTDDPRTAREHLAAAREAAEALDAVRF
jgi:uncharacterized Zn finger protein (UPF0148 family)